MSRTNGYTAIRFGCDLPECRTRCSPGAPADTEGGNAMADRESAPLSDEERAELEQLRAEKRQREQAAQAARARAERAELERLRAERATAPQRPASAPRRRAVPSRTAAAAEKPIVDPEHLTFGQKMVLSDEHDDDDMPAMPPAQKLIIAICVIGLVVAIGWYALSNSGIL